jgi:hypothetical protein
MSWFCPAFWWRDSDIYLHLWVLITQTLIRVLTHRPFLSNLPPSHAPSLPGAYLLTQLASQPPTQSIYVDFTLIWRKNVGNNAPTPLNRQMQLRNISDISWVCFKSTSIHKGACDLLHSCFNLDVLKGLGTVGAVVVLQTRLKLESHSVALRHFAVTTWLTVGEVLLPTGGYFTPHFLLQMKSLANLRLVIGSCNDGWTKAAVCASSYHAYRKAGATAGLINCSVTRCFISNGNLKSTSASCGSTVCSVVLLRLYRLDPWY